MTTDTKDLSTRKPRITTGGSTGPSGVNSPCRYIVKNCPGYKYISHAPLNTFPQRILGRLKVEINTYSCTQSLELSSGLNSHFIRVHLSHFCPCAPNFKINILNFIGSETIIRSMTFHNRLIEVWNTLIFSCFSGIGLYSILDSLMGNTIQRWSNVLPDLPKA